MSRLDQLIFFVKAPKRGEVKSRLAAEIGDEKALSIYKAVATRSLNSLRKGLYDLQIACYPPDEGEMVSEWLGPDLNLQPQKGAELGERMGNAFRDAFYQGAEKVVLVGSDIPGLERYRVEEAFSALEDNDAVINPTFDGGYCLIGFAKQGFQPAIFRGIKWSSESVFKDTIEIFSRKGTTVRVLRPLHDIDRAEDLKYFPEFSETKKIISVIVPVLGEAESINPLVRHLLSLDGAEECEIIVIDGDPGRGTVDAIEEKGIRKIVSEKGRARQMNMGAGAAKGEILLFLHADTYLPANAFRKIRDTIAGGRYVGGAFNLSLDSSRPLIRFISRAGAIRTRLTHIPYGDQAIFLRRDYFMKIGRYKEISLMEDVELMRRIKRLGGKIRILNEPASTSARKYLRDGPLYAASRNCLLRILFDLGTPPEKLEKLYYKG